MSTFYYLKNQQIARYTWIFHRLLDIASFPYLGLGSRIIFIGIPDL
jgi:hypothetical protein